MISSQPCAVGDLGLLLGRDGADHAQAEQLGPLDGDQADAAGRGVQQDGVAGLHPRVGLQQPVGGAEAAHGRGGGGFMADPVGQLDQRADRHHPLGRIGAERAAGVGDAVAGREAGDARPDRLDHAGGLDAHAVGQGHGIIAEAEIGVGEVEADRDVADADLARARFADLDLLVAQDLGATRFVEAYRLRHRCYPAQLNSKSRPSPAAACNFHKS